MDRFTIDKYLNALYLKSKSDFKKGYSEKVISRMAGIDKTVSQNVLHYLSARGLIDTKNGYGDNILLTPTGIDYIQNLRENKTFKTIKFKVARYIPLVYRECSSTKPFLWRSMDFSIYSYFEYSLMLFRNYIFPEIKCFFIIRY